MSRNWTPRGEIVEIVAVPFHGEGSGEGELAFGQRGLWQAMAGSTRSLTVKRIFPAEPGTTVDDIAGMLTFLIGRHEALRTLLVPAASGWTSALPRQRVHESGEVELLVVAAGDDDPAEVAAAIGVYWQTLRYSYDTEWPIRMAAITRGDGSDRSVAQVVMVVLHTSLDAFGGSAMWADYEARDPVTGLAAGPVTGWPPLAQAAFEASPIGRRQNQQSLRHLETALREAPTRMFGEPRHPGEERYTMLRYRSRAIALAGPVAAARAAGVARLNDSSVLLAAFTIGVARIAQVHPIIAITLVSNRFRPNYATSVSALVKLSPIVLDVAGLTIGEAVTKAGGRALAAYRNAYYDAYEQDEVISAVEAERGPLELSCYYNDRRQRTRGQRGAPHATATEIRAALADSEVIWPDRADVPGNTLYLSIDDPPGTIDLLLSADKRYVDTDELVALAREIEAVTVQAALHPQSPTGIAPHAARTVPLIASQVGRDVVAP